MKMRKKSIEILIGALAILATSLDAAAADPTDDVVVLNRKTWHNAPHQTKKDIYDFLNREGLELALTSRRNSAETSTFCQDCKCCIYVRTSGSLRSRDLSK
jgi:hypothetical protein